MNRKSLGLTLAALLLALPAHAAEKKCVLQRVAEMPVTMLGTRPLVSGTINGKPARFLADSGAFFSVLPRESADRYGLRIGPLPVHMRVRGTNGTVNMVFGKADTFSLDGFQGGYLFKDIDFLVGGSAIGRGSDGIIGQNVIGTADAEYDLANGFIRLFRAKDCDGTMLAYWAKNMSVASMDFERRTPGQPHLMSEARLNGKKIRVMFDTGASSSVLTLRAAARAGIEPEDEDVDAAGISRGLGKQTRENWEARFETLDLGGEVIKNARLRLADIQIGDSGDMLLGADFFLSHRVYVASEDRKIYFTYNGGPVFDLRRGNQPVVTAATTSDDSPQEGGAKSPDENLDAAALRRRAAASVSRGDLQAATADLDRAVQSDPTDAESYYHRGTVHQQARRPVLALADFEQALKLKPDHVPALVSRGTARLARKNKPDALADFDAAIRLAPQDVEVPLRVARTFQALADYDEAIARFDAWQKEHPKNDRLPAVLVDRCWSRAMANRELSIALDDCDAALKKGLRNSAAYDSRAFVYLRQGNFDKAIADYNSALKLQPKGALSIYGRGLAQLKKGLQAEGEADIKAARELDPKVGEMYARVGVVP
jgi:tetratricopeptide (TPR) repeat protein/predicted aspartyl protease